MKHFLENKYQIVFVWILNILLLLSVENVNAQQKVDCEQLNVAAYLASYNHYAPPGGNWGNYPTEAVEWSVIDRLLYFALNVEKDGSLSVIKKYKNVSPSRINAIVEAAHQREKPVLITVGGWGNYKEFSRAIRPPVRSQFIENLVNLIEKWGFDGIDLDMEPIKNADVSHYKSFVSKLREKLNTLDTPVANRPLLTAVTGKQPKMFADIQDKLDHIYLMTYDMSGAWSGWVTWHNAPIYSGGNKFPNHPKLLPSTDNMVDEYLEAGVKKEKLSIGIDFYGYVWKGVSKPGQQWDAQPNVIDNVPYYKIVKKYYESRYYHWDRDAQAAYLSIEDKEKETFVSFDDEQTVKAKINYACKKGLSGVFIWDLSAGYFKKQPQDSRDPLIDSMKRILP